MTDLLNWFAGGASRYMTLVHCMNHDTFWIVLTVGLDLLVATGYLVIALHWRRNESIMPPSPSKSALGTMKNIFVYCGLCGYVFIPVKMFWPAWRLYDGFLAVLAYYTWRYALRAHNLRVVYEELGRSAKLAENLVRLREEGRRRSHFLNAISHDLKTPLNGMMLQADLAELSLSTSDPATLREALLEIKSCARTTADLLNRFLEYGRLESTEEPSKVDQFDLDELLRHVANQARGFAEQKGLKLVNHCHCRLSIETDRLKLERVLSNLVDNAIKFTREGSVQLTMDSSPASVRIHVEDTGAGIAAEHQAMIFDDFTQVHNRERDSRKGFGLGLAISRRLARQLGGELAVQSELGRGSRFTVALPINGGLSWIVEPGGEPRRPVRNGPAPAPRG